MNCCFPHSSLVSVLWAAECRRLGCACLEGRLFTFELEGVTSGPRVCAAEVWSVSVLLGEDARWMGSCVCAMSLGRWRRSRTQVPPIVRDLRNPRVCLKYLWSSWHWCEGLWVECAGRVDGTGGQPSEGTVVCALRDSFVTLFVGSLSLLLGWEASCSENTCGEGGGVTRACGPQPRDQPQPCVRACLSCV